MYYNLIKLTRALSLQVFDLSKRDAKLISSVSLADHFQDCNQAIEMKVNSDGTFLSFIGAFEPSVLKIFCVDLFEMISNECETKVITFN